MNFSKSPTYAGFCDKGQQKYKLFQNQCIDWLRHCPIIKNDKTEIEVQCEFISHFIIIV